MTPLVQAILDGLLVGGVYGVVAVGLSLVFGVLGIVNFAQAEFLMLGMYVAWFAWSFLGLDPMLGAVLALAAGFMLGYVIQRLLVQRVMSSDHVAQIFLTVGLLAVMENGALMIFGPDFRSVQTDAQMISYRLGPFFISAVYLKAFVAAVAISVALWALLNRTWLGRAIRATAQDAPAAQLFGINTRWIYGIAFGLGAALTAFGGGIVLSFAPAYPTIGANYVVLMFTVVVLGGLGSVMGALLGGLLVGIVQSASTLVLPIQLQNLALFVIFIAVLALRPEGLLGKAAK
ncbi:branched-chain amino acid ABC transporter permease [Allosediminivita pacifica]|uniref:Amino acid/amide ABC transporter membrane protein 1 (HAAT family) n=1 Tax=Allosediminivita pacifica TaxID=1267769 RepID=A0A2T6A4E6_9RHOB|nr:branched-chain amino acid ABC transporter permease [Allosediminivita pacifica]PTX38668.1 amino acid/amide ABC transporter membrane protein 1 (HAAT family) [Allosediminivita pacifica]GGB28937.1 branched-chain amino acid ABC transporter permease [Allosediminivita pacifica]